jgi:hypothetical protein
MHAVVVRVNVGDPENSQEELRAQVVPRVFQSPGFVAGYCTLRATKVVDDHVRIRGCRSSSGGSDTEGSS